MIDFGPGDYPEIAKLAGTLDLEVSDSVAERLGKFAELASVWGKKTDLVSAKSVSALVEVLFLDAFALASLDVVPEGASFVDIGAGAGAPAIPLLVLREDLRGVLVEPRRKRVAFMRTAVGGLGLQPRADVLETRLYEEEIDPKMNADIAFSRATFGAEKWKELGLLLSPRVVVLTSEAASAEDRTVLQRSYRVPSSGAKRAIHVLKR